MSVAFTALAASASRRSPRRFKASFTRDIAGENDEDEGGACSGTLDDAWETVMGVLPQG